MKAEFPHLQSKVYADHAGAALYTQGQIDAVKQVISWHNSWHDFALGDITYSALAFQKSSAMLASMLDAG